MARHFKQIMEDISNISMEGREQTIRDKMNLNLKEFADKVATFNKLGEALYGGGNFSKLAEDLEEIATHAEAYTLRETEDDPFDQVTIRRNMKELKSYTNEFKKVASEARSLQERMTALYEDSGRVLGRYFEIKEMGQPDGMGGQNDLMQKSENEKIVGARAGVREAVSKCSKCGKPVKENTHGNPKYCQGHGFGESKMCEGCGKPMSECACESVNEGETLCPGCDKPMSQCTCAEQVHEARRFKKGIRESMKLKRLMEDISNDYPKEDWVKLDVPMLRYDVAKEFEKDLKKKFDVRRFDWKERAGQAQEFSEFFVHLKDYDDANAYAVKMYPSYDENSRMENE